MHVDADRVLDQCDLFLSIGTSGSVEPAASLPYRALERGATVVISNLEVRDRATPSLYYVQGKAGSWRPKIVSRLHVGGEP